MQILLLMVGFSFTVLFGIVKSLALYRKVRCRRQGDRMAYASYGNPLKMLSVVENETFGKRGRRSDGPQPISPDTKSIQLVLI